MSDLLAEVIELQTLEQQMIDSGLREDIDRLRAWQCQRLLFTYQSFYQQKRFAAAIDFFVSELYGPGDFTQRDQDIEKAIPMIENAVSAKTANTFLIALKLNNLSYHLDYQLVTQLPDNQPLNSKTYAEAYRACDNKTQRTQQLAYIERLAYDLNHIANRASIMMLLRLSRLPARLAGLGELQRILESGATAFRKIGPIDDFIKPIVNGETALMNDLFDGKDCLPNI